MTKIEGNHLNILRKKICMFSGAKLGIQGAPKTFPAILDSRLRGNDGVK
jgi:hypothetical protein